MSDYNKPVIIRYPDRPHVRDLDLMCRGLERLPHVLKQLGFVGLRKGQETAIMEIMCGRDTLCVMPTGGGKCFGKGTRILMADGTVKDVEDIIVGDLVMGPDSKPRRVESLHRGADDLYEIVSKKGDRYVVNSQHILSLRLTSMKRKHRAAERVRCGDRQYESGEVANVSVHDYLHSTKSFRHCAKGWKAGVEFPAQPIHPDMPPYILGLWLGDGSTDKPEITNPEPEIREAWMQYAASMEGHSVNEYCNTSKCPQLVVTTGRKGGGFNSNRMTAALRELGVFGDKFLPDSYLRNSRSIRLELLAGIVDTDGHLHHGGFDIIQKNERMANEIVFLARSLGLSATIAPCKKGCQTGAVGDYFRMYIGGDTSVVPCRLPRRRTGDKDRRTDALMSGITVNPVGFGAYFGFEVSGPDHLFLLEDFTVVHNSAVTIIPTLALNYRTVFFMPLVALMRDQMSKMDAWGVAAAQMSGLQSEGQNQLAAKKWASGELNVLYVAPERLRNPLFIAAMDAVQPDMVAVDEAHCIPGDYQVITEFGNRDILDIYKSFEAGHQLPRVKCIDERTGEEHWREVENAMRRGEQSLVAVSVQDTGVIECTADHEIFTQRGMVPAGQLKPGEDFVVSYNVSQKWTVRIPNSQQMSIMLGSYLGDGGTQCVSRKKHSYRIRYGHGMKQERYLLWKLSAFDVEDRAKTAANNGFTKGRTLYAKASSLCYQMPGYLETPGRWKKKGSLPEWVVSRFDALALAIFAMDDGSGEFNRSGDLTGFSLHINDYDKKGSESVAAMLLSNFGIVASIHINTKRSPSGDRQYFYLRLSKPATDRLVELVRPFIHPDCAYKFGMKLETSAALDAQRINWHWSPVRSVNPSNRSAEVFDLTVREHHNFFVIMKLSPTKQRKSVQAGYDSGTAVCVSNCLDMWGDNFRPDYVHIGDFIRDRRPKTVVAITATMDESAEASIRRVLCMNNAAKVAYYYRRTNLHLHSREMRDVEEVQDYAVARGGEGATLVYCSSIKNAESMAVALQNQTDLPVGLYHGELPDDTKRRSLDDFMADRIRIMVATKAFGMGVDKSNIRAVVHRDMPGSPDDYAQESGRGGRDGKDTKCMAYMHPDGIRTQRYFIMCQNPSKDDVLRVFDALRKMVDSSGMLLARHKDVGDQAGVNPGVVGACMDCMRAANVIQSKRASGKFGTLRFTGMTEDDKFRKFHRAVLMTGREVDNGVYEIINDKVADQMGVKGSTVATHIRKFREEKMVDYVPPFNGSEIRVIGDVQQVEFARLAEKQRRSYEKLDRMIDLMNTPDEKKHEFLEKYLKLVP